MANTNRKKTWFLAPTWDIPPSAIRLGYLVADPTDPRYAINPIPTSSSSASDAPNGYPPPIDTEIFQDTDHDGFNMELSGETSIRLGLWAQFLQVIGLTAKVRLERSKDMLTSYSVEKAWTEWFNPSLNFVRFSVNTKGVADFLDMAGFRRPLYMVVGVKAMSGASISTCYTKGHSYEAKFGFDSTMAGAPMAAGPEYKHTISNSEAAEYKKEGPIVFAYQLVKIKLRNNNARATPYSKGAMFEVREDDGKASIEVELLSDDLSDIQSEGKKGKRNKKGFELLESFEEGTNEECIVVVPSAST